MTGIANQYALAVFSLAKEENREEDFVLLLEKISNEISEDSLKFFAHPKISKAEKREFLTNVIEDKLLLNFLKVLVDNDRISLLKAITLAYKDILDDINKTMVVKVISNGPLTKSNLERISKKLSATYNRKIKIIEEADKTIIGGFRLEFEGNILDETINKQLEDLKTSLVE
jgi:F-type H+-transporting ATPase subunit delta